MKQTIIYKDVKPVSDGTVPLIWLTGIKDGENDLCFLFILAYVELYWLSKKWSNILFIFQVCRAVNRLQSSSMLIALQCQQNSLKTHGLAVFRVKDSQTIMEFQHSWGFGCQ